MHHFVSLWISKRRALLRKGVPIETKRIAEWKKDSATFSKTSIDWKGREMNYSDDRPSNKYKRVFKSQWRYESGTPFRITSNCVIPKSFGYAPEQYTKGKRKFYCRSLQVQPNEKTSFHIGKFPARFGSRPNVFRFPDETSTSYFLEKGFVEGNSANLKSPRNYIHVSGTWDTNFHTIQKQMDTGLEEKEMNLDDFERNWIPSLRSTLSKLKIVELQPPCLDDIGRVEISPSTYAGCRWDKFFELGTKGKAAPYAKRVAEDLFRKTSKKFRPSDSLWTIGGREAREDECLEDGTDVTSRGVHMPEIHEELVNFLWSKPVEKFFHSKIDGPIWLGQSFNSGGWKRLKNNLDWSESVLEGDWKKFDSSINEEKIVIALAIVRSFYPKGRWIDRHFLRICDQMVFKNYVVPGGYMFRICSGIPSGSAFTALVNSIVNFICLNRICHDELSLKRKNSYRMAIGGDDFLIFFKRGPGNVEQIVEAGKTILGMDLKESSKWTIPYPERILDAPSFYKQIIYKDLPTIRPDHLYERLLAPNSMIRKGWSPELYFDSLFASPPYPFMHLEWLIHLVSIYSKQNNLPITEKEAFKRLKLRFERTALFSDKELEEMSKTSSTSSARKSTIYQLDTTFSEETFSQIRKCFNSWNHSGKSLIGKSLMRKLAVASAGR